MQYKIFKYGILLFGLLNACIYRFDPPSEGYENLLVVEAFLTDGEDPFQMKLSRSTQIDTNGYVPEENALVSISENSGPIYDLVEVDPGLYMSFELRAEIGKTYQLHFQTADGKRYESEAIILRRTPPIDSVYFQFEKRFTEDSDSPNPGLQIYLTSHDERNNTWYYRWEYEETWEFTSKYNSTHILEDGVVKERDEQIFLCWKHDISLHVLVGTSHHLSEDIIYGYPVTYISNATDKLISKYSILVRQFALSERSYNYWKDIKKMNENLGTLFDPQPYALEGNIHNIDDEDEIVLGFFDASSVQEERIFIQRGDFPYFKVRNYYVNCIDTVGSLGLVDLGYMLIGVTSRGQLRFSSPGCIDCTIAGTNERPDFWK